MNVALICDQILDRGPEHRLVEVLSQYFENVRIYTLAHEPGAVSGPIEHRPITSTYLSRIAHNKQRLKALQFLSPGALRSLRVDPKTDVIVSISNGSSHQYRSSGNMAHISYVFKLEETPANRLHEKLFAAYVRKWKNQKPQSADKVFTSSKALAKNVGWDAEVLFPVFPIEKYEVIPLAKKASHFVLNGEGASSLEIDSAIKLFLELKIDLLIWNPPKLNIDKSEHIKIVNGHCGGELAGALELAYGLIDFNRENYSERAMAALACGRPIITFASDQNQEFYKEINIPLIDMHDSDQLKGAVIQVIGFYPNYNQTLLRRAPLKMNESRFKLTIDRTIKGLLKELRPSALT